MNSLQSIEEGRFGAGETPKYFTKEEVLDMFEKDIVLTGSRKWDVNSEDSDYDYICCDSDIYKIKKYKDNFLSYYENNGGSSSKINKLGNSYNLKITCLDGEVLNFISYPFIETVLKFNIVNDRMLDEVSRKHLRDKAKRHMNFEIITKELGIHNNTIIYLDEDEIPFGY